MSAQYVKEDRDGGCMAQGIPGHWRESLTCSDGSVVIGTGATALEAEMEALRQKDEHEHYLKLPPEERLRRLVSGDLLDTDQRAAIRLLAELVLKVPL